MCKANEKSFLGVEISGSRNTDSSQGEEGTMLWNNNKDICRFLSSKRGVSQNVILQGFFSLLLKSQSLRNYYYQKSSIIPVDLPREVSHKISGAEKSPTEWQEYGQTLQISNIFP